MSKLAIIVAVGLGILAGAPLRGAAPGTQPAALEALVEQLSSNDWRARQRAQDQLVELGDEAAPRLQQLVRQSQDEEVRTRAEAALKQIELNNKAAPTLITLHLKDVPVATAIAELEKQARTTIAVWPPMQHQPDQGKVTIDADRQPFWLVVRELCAQAKYAPANMNQGRQITLQRSSESWARAPFVQHQCFFVTADSASRSHHVDYSNPGNIQTNFYLQLRVLVDPKLRVLQGPGNLMVDEAIDEKGNALAVQRNWGSGYNPWGAWMWSMSVPLQYQADIGTRIKLLRGSAQFIVLAKSQTWEIDDVLNAREQEKMTPANVKYVFKGVKKQGENNYQAQITVLTAGRPDAGRDPMTDAGTIQQSLRLVDAAGQAYSNSGYGGGGGMNQRSYSFSFYSSNPDGKKLGPPVKLIWEIPLELKQIAVPVEFKDLPIP